MAPASMPAVERFGLRIRALLDTPLCTHADRELQPIELALAAPAHARIERALAAGADFTDIRDLATKAAENDARLAELFRVLAHAPGGVIDADAIQAAATVIACHLHEARRRDGHRIPTQHVYQFDPSCVRDSKAMRPALATLSERARARMEEDAKRRFVVMYPALASG